MFDKEIQELRGSLGECATIERGDVMLVRFQQLPLPPGCRPASTPVVVRLRGKERPVVYVRKGIVCPSGEPPRSTSDELVEGEPWMRFSYAFPWQWKDGLLRFVLTSLLRFRSP
ncbi:MAG: hypothetical protein IPK72_02010 [Candidatus Eisenbacteria bacterium]|nr:hypothetical protein [Candidatus Eisenbacteria bacterium]